MNIRNANKDDYADIISIYNHAVDEKYATADTEYVTVESRKEWFAQHSQETYPIYVAEQDGEIIGWCSLSPHRPEEKHCKPLLRSATMFIKITEEKELLTL